MDRRDVGPDDPIPPTVSWSGGAVRLIDQRALPEELRFVDCRTPEEICDAITTMAVRGAPALGATAAFGVALAAVTAEGTSEGPSVDAVLDEIDRAASALTATRPTAVNLAWGASRVRDAAREMAGDGSADPSTVARAALAAAERIAADDVSVNRAIGRHGVELVPDRARVLTHCDTGSLACVGWGTALGVVRAAAEAGREPSVWVGETRPALQGARLTAWELTQLGIEGTLVVDSAAASLMARGEVDLVVVGADRIAANGDVANKIGTYGLAVAARRHGVPFYVAAPMSTVDPGVPNGAAVPIEERPAHEVTVVGSTRLAPAGFPVYNPAFDITPADLVTAVVTEHGVCRAPSELLATGPAS